MWRKKYFPPHSSQSPIIVIAWRLRYLSQRQRTRNFNFTRKALRDSDIPKIVCIAWLNISWPYSGPSSIVHRPSSTVHRPPSRVQSLGFSTCRLTVTVRVLVSAILIIPCIEWSMRVGVRRTQEKQKYFSRWRRNSSRLEDRKRLGWIFNHKNSLHLNAR